MNIKDAMWDAGKIVIVIYTFKWTYYCSKECHVIKGAFFLGLFQNEDTRNSW